MVAKNTVRLYGINRVFRFVEGICIHRELSNPIFIGKHLFYFICAQPVLSYHLTSTMGRNRGSYNKFGVIWGQTLISGSLRKDYVIYYVFHILPRIHTANHAIFLLQMCAVTVLICSNF